MFEIASASVLGRDHVAPGKNNQDAFFTAVPGDGSFVAIVCDGCGSSPHSEVGAQFGARLITSELLKRLPKIRHTAAITDVNQVRLMNESLEDIRQDVLAHLRVLANSMGGHFAQTVQDYFLFTVVGMVMTPELSCVFHLGDGVGYANGQLLNMGEKSATNSPPYLGYGLIADALAKSVDPANLRFRLNILLETEEVSSILIGTDGAEALFSNPSMRLPGKTETIGAVSRLWTEDRFYKNPDALRRFLTLVNREHTRINWKDQVVDREHGCLKDDTTIVVLRRMPRRTPEQDA